MGKVIDIITNIVTFFMRGKIKKIDNMIDPKARKELAESAKRLKESIDKYNKNLEKPSVKKSIEEMGGSIEDYKLKDL